jgi:dipeptidyl aminopeptidase/acylaminoacyl peptidase
MKDVGYGGFRDIVHGVVYVLKTYPIDRNRIGIIEHGYGGYMSIWAVTQTDVFHASVPSAGISDWLGYVGEADISKGTLPYFGVSVHDDPALYARMAPMTYIKNVKTPICSSWWALMMESARLINRSNSGDSRDWE